MNDFPKKEQVQRIRQQYPPGTRVELIRMEDPHSKLQPGDRGTVSTVDDIGTIHCHWDCGSGLGLAYGEDQFRKLIQQELDEEQMEQKMQL